MNQIGKIPAERQEQAAVSHTHYFRDVSNLDKLDVYRLLELFGVTCPVAQHVIKKAIAAGQRGHKPPRKDWQDIADSAARKLEMLDEDDAAVLAELGGPAAFGLEPAVVANVAAFNGDWPNESRRTVEFACDYDGKGGVQVREAEWEAAEARMDVIGTNGNGGEHYPKPCEYPGADGVLYPCEHCTGRGHPGCAVRWDE